MSHNSGERREFPRFYFTPDDKVYGTIKPYDTNSEDIHIQILNISVGGLAFKPMTEESKFKEGDRIILTEIKSLPFTFRDKIELKVIWTLKIPHLESSGVGGTFVNLPENLHHIIQELVKNRQKQIS